jgi:hypothetical protein
MTVSTSPWQHPRSNMIFPHQEKNRTSAFFSSLEKYVKISVCLFLYGRSPIRRRGRGNALGPRNGGSRDQECGPHDGPSFRPRSLPFGPQVPALFIFHRNLLVIFIDLIKLQG